MYSIKIVNQYHYHASVIFGIEVLGPSKEFPLLVGCSLRTAKGQVVDIPARWLLSPGLALWEVKVDRRFLQGDNPQYGWHGHIIFALWRNEDFINSLSDTDWVNWTAPWLQGGSTYGLDLQDQEIRNKYGHRMKAWKDGKIGVEVPGNKDAAMAEDVWNAMEASSIAPDPKQIATIFTRGDKKEVWEAMKKIHYYIKDNDLPQDIKEMYQRLWKIGDKIRHS